MDDKVIIILKIAKQKKVLDIEVPLDITVIELLNALNIAYDLGVDTSDAKQCYLKMENPIALMKGNNLLSDYGMRNGSIINFTR